MLHIVLFEPEIPQNTGNIMRTCAALNAKLHLIEPLGFVLDEKRVRRAVMDYIDVLDYTVYPNMDAFMSQMNGSLYYMTRYGKKRIVQSSTQKIKISISCLDLKVKGFRPLF